MTTQPRHSMDVNAALKEPGLGVDFLAAAITRRPFRTQHAGVQIRISMVESRPTQH